jgi:hypothetical protein
MLASCHKLMDPLGFSLEHYDGVGAWRDSDQGQPIDATGTMPDGRAFDGATQLASILKSDPSFPRCAVQKFFSYALGRVPAPYDALRMNTLFDTFSSQGFRLKTLMLALISDDAFRMRRGGN